MIGVGPGWEGTYGEPPLRPVNRRLAPTQVRILVLPPPRRPADTWSPSGPGRATRRARLRSDVAPADALRTRWALVAPEQGGRSASAGGSIRRVPGVGPQPARRAHRPRSQASAWWAAGIGWFGSPAGAGLRA